MALKPNVAPSDNFDLANWKITLPVGLSCKASGVAVKCAVTEDRSALTLADCFVI